MAAEPTQHAPSRVEYRDVDPVTTERANRRDWDRESDDYQREHGDFLGDVGFVWGPEGLDEAQAHLLGDVAGCRVLEVGCGAGQCARWLAEHGAGVIGIDLSFRQLQHSRRIDVTTGLGVATACATVTALPLPDEAFDLACSAFGALPFVIDIERAIAEVSRVLRPGGRFAFSVVHPMRWVLPDDPTEYGLTVVRSYFDSRPYVELDADGQPSYVEPHHTLGEWVAAITGAGLRTERLVEPEWPDGHTRQWGGWGPARGAMVPGTAIFVTSKVRTPGRT